MRDCLYEVLLHAEIPTRVGAKGRWYLGSAHPDLAGAEASYRALEADFPSPKVTVAMVRSEHEPRTGLFVDRIVKARGLVPMIARKSMERLDPATREAIANATAPPKPEVVLPPAAAAVAASRGGGWLWIGCVAATVGLFAAITVGR
ncbi:hypothetical protein [Elioraea sp.]|uniref:hypothetical protein n=1 Tax=Elioraea sp. TaxID=2185103 RepID=UPI0025BD8153|nr:hypothetical protein [Elioraea sp.]